MPDNNSRLGWLKLLIALLALGVFLWTGWHVLVHILGLLWWLYLSGVALGVVFVTSASAITRRKLQPLDFAVLASWLGLPFLKWSDNGRSLHSLGRRDRLGL